MAESGDNDDGPLRIAVICEARADFQIGTELADRVIYRDIDWLTDAIIDHVRRWCGPHDSEHVDPWLRWDDVEHLNEARLRPDPNSRAPDGFEARHAPRQARARAARRWRPTPGSALLDRATSRPTR